MDIHDKDTIRLAQWVAQLMKEDGLTVEDLENAGSDLALSTTLKYLDVVTEKIAEIQVIYRHNPEARAAMQQKVMALCKA